MVAVPMNLQGFTAEDCERSGDIAPGRYHVVVEEATYHADDASSYIGLRMRILAGTAEGQAGQVHTERLYLTEKAVKRAALFALKLGLLTPEQFGTRAEVQWDRAAGRQLIVEIHDEPGKDRNGNAIKRAKITYQGVWAPTDERVADVPRGQVAQVPQRVTPGGKPAARPAPVPATAAKKADGFDDI